MARGCKGEGSLTRPQLIPAQVPWSIGATVSYLEVEANSAGQPMSATFLAFFALEEISPRVAIILPDAPGSFEPTDGKGNSPFRMVRVNFIEGAAYRTTPAVSERKSFPSDEYDWSGVPAVLRDDESVLQNLERSSKFQRRTGHSADPGMYEVIESGWLRELSSKAGQLHHYLLRGTENYAEVLARGWSWERGQSVGEPAR